jgi:hypothetical protein
MIIAIVMAITIPLAWGALSEYSKNQMETTVRNEVEKIISTARLAYNSGDKTSIHVKVLFPRGLFTRVEYVKIGDKIDLTRDPPEYGKYVSIIRYKLTGRPQESVVINPNIPITNLTHEDNMVTLRSGEYTLIFTHHLSGAVSFVEVGLKR